MFQEVNSKINFPQLEESILRFWKEHGIFAQTIEAGRGKQHYVFYEGPPTANGSPGVHHVLSRLFKDITCRYKTMKGYHVPRKAGWDTHGLPVELEAENKLGFTGKAQIEEYGIAQFNQKCRESVFRYINEWEQLTERIGCWLDMEHPYITLDAAYIESCWWIVKELWDKGLIYQGYKVTPHCPRCGTSLSSHEVALGYRDDADDPSVYVKFRVPREVVSGYLIGKLALRLDPGLTTCFLAWTTTPWTLPGNTALAVAPEADYAIVKVEIEGDVEQLILAEALIADVLIHPHEILSTCKGKELVGMGYEPLYRLPQELYQKWGDSEEVNNILSNGTLMKRAPAPGENFGLIAGDFVSLDEGTGIVHIAPAFGEVDYKAGYSDMLYFVQPVDEQGIMMGNPLFAGKFVKDADPFIINDLHAKRLLYRSGRVVHTYPFCWRCETPLLYYAKRSWYIRTTAVKDKLISGNSKINWHPDYIKYGRFGDWLKNNVDWAFSRERYWGTPLNVWHCQNCNNYECVGSIAELKTRSNITGLEMLQDLHRPYVDEITFACSKCSGKMQRVPEVIDCWFDSGAMPIAQWHYPFENENKFEQNFPADFICEAIDQTRGWFYSLHAISTMLFNQPCFENVICLGHVVDAQGEKMSKSKNNMVEPWTVINNYGADVLRWYMLTSAPGEDNHRFSTQMLTESLRRFLLTLWNTYSFFILYANIDRFVPTSLERKARQSQTLLDAWIISELNQLLVEVNKALDNYNPTLAARHIEVFVDDLSNWYVRRSRRRFWKSENDVDKLAAYTTLYQCLVTISQLLAPLTPFIAEGLYQNLVRSVDSKAKESVHLTDFPVADVTKIDHKLNNNVRLARKISSLGRAARAKAGIKVRQPLGKAVLKVKSEEEREALTNLVPEIMEEINVKEIIILDSPSSILSEAKDLYQEFSHSHPGYSVAGDAGYEVAVSTGVTSELLAEGTSREIVRRLQNMRRAAKFDIADHIVTYYQAAEPLRQVMIDFASYIEQETLSQELIDALPPKEAYAEKLRISQHEILLGIKKVS